MKSVTCGGKGGEGGWDFESLPIRCERDSTTGAWDWDPDPESDGHEGGGESHREMPWNVEPRAGEVAGRAEAM